MKRPAGVTLLPLLPLLTLTLLPAVHADEGLQAHSVSLVDADGLDAGLHVLQRTTALGAPAELALQAESLRVETDARTVWTGAAGTPARTTTTQHADARLTGLSARTDGRLFVVPDADGARLEETSAACGRADPATRERFLYAPVLGGRPTLRVPLDAAVSWTPCADAGLTLRGDLTLVLWAWDARLTSDHGVTDLQSGRGDAVAGDGGARELFLFARNATLTLPPAAQTLYVESLSATAGSVRLGEAEGRLDDAAVHGDLRLAGSVDVLVQGRGAGRPMAVTVGGTIDEATLDDRALPAPATGWRWWPLLVAGVGVVGLQRARPHLHYLHAERTGGELGSLVPQTLRQRRAVGLWIMARRAELRHRYRSSRRRATRANDLFRPFPEAQFTRAVAAAGLGQHADAMTDFLDLYHRYDEPMGRAAAACGMAQQCCRLRKWDAGQEWLLMAALQSLQYTQRAALAPDFDHYEGEPWFDALRRGEPVGASGPGGSAETSCGDPSIH